MRGCSQCRCWQGLALGLGGPQWLGESTRGRSKGSPPSEDRLGLAWYCRLNPMHRVTESRKEVEGETPRQILRRGWSRKMRRGQRDDRIAKTRARPKEWLGEKFRRSCCKRRTTAKACASSRTDREDAGLRWKRGFDCRDAAMRVSSCRKRKKEDRVKVRIGANTGEYCRHDQPRAEARYPLWRERIAIF